MKPPPFEYHAPASVHEVVETLAAYDDEAKILAGGQSLLPLLNLRLSAPRALVDLGKVPELRGREVGGDVVEMGAMTSHADALADEQVATKLPALAGALHWVAHPAIRNAGTIGGSLAHADPAAELPMMLVLLEGEVVAQGRAGERVIPASEFFLTYFTTALEENEVLTRVRWPIPKSSPGGGLGWGFRELARRRGDFCLTASSALVSLDANGRASRARVVVGGVSDRPLHLQEVDALLAGEVPNDGLLRQAAELAARSVEPPSDIHASSEYRRQLVRVLTLQALTDSVVQAKEVMAA